MTEAKANNAASAADHADRPWQAVAPREISRGPDF
jgi:hypothetical protein